MAIISPSTAKYYFLPFRMDPGSETYECHMYDSISTVLQQYNVPVNFDVAIIPLF